MSFRITKFLSTLFFLVKKIVYSSHSLSILGRAFWSLPFSYSFSLSLPLSLCSSLLRLMALTIKTKFVVSEEKRDSPWSQARGEHACTYYIHTQQQLLACFNRDEYWKACRPAAESASREGWLDKNTPQTGGWDAARWMDGWMNICQVEPKWKFHPRRTPSLS